jgi:hypothetical protein
MKKLLKTLLLAFLIGLLIGMVRLRRADHPALIVRAKAMPAQVAAPSSSRDPDNALETGFADSHPPPSNPNEQKTLAAKPFDPVPVPDAGSGLPPEIVLQNLRTVFRDYAARFGGNPVGTNLEISSRLNGGNRKRVVFLKPEDGMRLNNRGELVDNWGTPYFFHQLSNTEMEIHSAGPDRLMWTSDDLVTK